MCFGARKRQDAILNSSYGVRPAGSFVSYQSSVNQDKRKKKKSDPNSLAYANAAPYYGGVGGYAGDGGVPSSHHGHHNQHGQHGHYGVDTSGGHHGFLGGFFSGGHHGGGHGGGDGGGGGGHGGGGCGGGGGC